MARLRSPAYPNITLADAIDYARKIHDQDRQHSVPRDVAAQHMGFAGPSGASDRALSALSHYGLIEKAGKGEIRVSALALRILHPANPTERREALHQAAFNPDLFRDLRERYPGASPTQATLASHLARMNFAPIAIPPATKAYLETCNYLQRENAYDAIHGADKSAHEAQTPSLSDYPATAQVAAPPQTQSAALEKVITSEPTQLKLNAPEFVIRGGTVKIEALLDHEGLDHLAAHLNALRLILKPTTHSRVGSSGEEAN